MTGISNQISMTYRSVIEEIFKFRVYTVQETFTFVLLVNNQRKKCMPKIIGWLCICCTGKTGGFLSLQITFAQGHLWAHIQDLKCSAGFWISKCFQQHIVIHISSLQGSSVYLFFFRDPVFIWKNTEPGFLWGRWGCSLKPAVLLWSMCFTVALGFLWGASSWGDCQWEPAATLSRKIWDTATSPTLASLNAKQHGVAQCWLSVQPSSPVKEPTHRNLAADQAGMLSWLEGLGTWLCVNSNKSSFELLNHPPMSARTGGNLVKRGHNRK